MIMIVNIYISSVARQIVQLSYLYYLTTNHFIANEPCHTLHVPQSLQQLYFSCSRQK